MFGRSKFWNILALLLVLGDVLRCRCDGQGGSDGDGRFLDKARRHSRSSGIQSRSRRGLSKGCGNTIKADSGFVRSPGFPTSYGPNLLCEWKLQVPSHKQILIRFVRLDVRGGARGHCTAGEDYLMIRDGTSSGRHLGIFCNPSSESGTPSPILSLTNHVWVIFHSNRRHAGQGFLISFMSVDTLDFSDFIAAQITFEASTDEPTDVWSSVTVNPREIENTVTPSSQIGSWFLPTLPTQRATGKTAMLGQDTESLTTDSRNEDMRIFESISGNPVHYSRPDGFAVSDQIVYPPPGFELGRQTVAELTSPNPMEENPVTTAIPVDDSSTSVKTEKLTTLWEPSHSESQTEDKLQALQPRALTDGIFTTPQSMTKRQMQTESVTRQQLETQTEQQSVAQTKQQAVAQTKQKAESVTHQQLDAETEQQPVTQTQQQYVTPAEQQAASVTQQGLEIQTEQQAVSGTEQQVNRQQLKNQTEQKYVTHTTQQAESFTQKLETQTERQAVTQTKQEAECVTQQQVLTQTEKQVGTQTEQQVSTQTEQQVGTQTEQQVSTQTEQQVSTQTEQQVSTQTEQQVSTQTEQQVSTQTEQQVSTQTEQQVSTQTEQQVSTQTEQQVSTQTEQQVSTQTEQQVSTQTEQQVSTQTEQQVSTQTEQQVSTQTEQQVSTQTEQQVSTQTEQQVSTQTEQQVSTQTEQQVSTQTEQQVSTQTEQQVSTQTEQQAESSTRQQLETSTERQAVIRTEQVVTPSRQQAQSVTQLHLETQMKQDAEFQTVEKAETSTEKQPENDIQLSKFQTRQQKEPSNVPTLYPDSSEQHNLDLGGLDHLFGDAISKIFILLTNINITDERSIKQTCKELNSTMNETLAGLTSLSNLVQNWEYIYNGSLPEATALDDEMGSSFAHQSSKAGPDGLSSLPFLFLQSLGYGLSALLSETGKILNATLQASIYIEPHIAEASCLKGHSQLLLNALQRDKNITGSLDHAEDMLGDMLEDMFQGLFDISDFVKQPTLYPPWNEFEVSEASHTKYPLCNAVLTAEAGIVASPNFPLPYPPSTSCLWVIYAAKSKRIALKFFSFDLEASPDCETAGDFLEVVNPIGMNIESWINTTYCAASPPSIVVSVMSAIGLIFVSNDLGTNGGFIAIYRHIHRDLADIPKDIDFPSDLLAEVRSQIGTEGLAFTSEPWDFSDNLDNPSGELKSPNYPGAYPVGVRVRWNITVGSRGVIVLSFTHFDLDSSSSEDNQCDKMYAHVKVEDDNNHGMGVQHVFCGREIPPTIISSSNTLIITFISGYGYGTGFHAQYVMQKLDDRVAIPDVVTAVLTPEAVCGGNHNEPSGVIQSPNLTGDFQKGVSCQWNITADVGQIVVLNFTYFDLDSVPIDNWCNEKYAHVKIADGNGGNNHTYCGQDVPPSFVSSTNTIVISFVSNYGDSGGFHAQYRVLQKDLKSAAASMDVLIPPSFETTGPSYSCGGNLQNQSGLIQSPNFPEDFETGVICQWNITVGAGQIIVLNFTDFDLDSVLIDNWCNDSSDHVKILDGNFGNIYVYCGHKQIPAFISSTNAVIVTFVSVYGYSGGFRARYTGIQMDDGRGLMEPRFQTTPTQSVHPSLAFEPSYRCGGNHNDPKGAIEAPKYPGAYSIGTHCRWNITVDAGWVIVLNFTTFDLDSLLVDGLCDDRYNHVKVIDGESSRYVFCGQENPPVIVSSTRTLIIDYFSAYGIGDHFQANYTSKEKGDALMDTKLIIPTLSKLTRQPTTESFPSEIFTDEVLFKCGGFLTTLTGEIQSPRQSGEQPRAFSCEWNITVDDQLIILINFTDFNLDSTSMNNNRCDERYDHIRVIDGKANDTGSEHMFCGQESPGILESSTNTLTIEFVTNTGYDGFSAYYTSMKPDTRFIYPIPTPVNVPVTTTSTASPTAVPYECGGNLNNPEGEIQSPDYSEELTSSVTCTWNITVEPGSTIALDFRVFRLDSLLVGNKCDTRYAHVSVLDGRNEATSVKYVHCGEDLPEIFLSSTNTLIVAFVSGFGYGGEIYAHYTSSKADSDSIDPKLITVSSRSSRTPTSGQLLVTDEPLYPCGGHLTTPNSMIQSPNFTAEMLRRGVDCRWKITVQIGMVIALDFIEFDLDSYPVENKCDDRYANVKVIDGGTDASPAQVFCGHDLPPRFISSSNEIIVIFNDFYGYSGGFRAQYSMLSSTSIATTKSIPVLPTLALRFLTPVKPEQPPSCGSVLSGISGTFSTPEYPNLYPANTFCSWDISTADHSRFVALRFLDFDVDGPMLLQNCSVRYSYVRISYRSEDGIEESRLLCGSNLPETIALSLRSHKVTVDFYSNLGIGRGFKAAYQTYEPTGDGSVADWPSFRLGPVVGATTPSLTLTSPENIEGASILTAQTGIINSPNYPVQYPRDSHNVWIIRPGQGTFITLVIDDIDFDVLTDDWDDGSCNTLYTHMVITVYNMDSRSTELIVCQNATTTSVFSHGELKIEFRSSYGMGRGFRAHYSSGFRIGGGGNAGSKEIVTPALADTSLPLTPSEFSETILIPPKENISKWCQYTFLESRGQFSSPNYPLVYPENIVCQWTMLAPAGQLVRLDFSRFQLDSADSSPCDIKYSHVVITTSDSIGDEEYTYCGKVIPPGIVSLSNKLVLTFRSQFGMEIGFLAEYQFIDEDVFKGSFGPVSVSVQNSNITYDRIDIETTKPPWVPEVERTIPTWEHGPDNIACDIMLTDPEGVISSPNFPEVMATDVQCVWTILIPGNQGIHLNFVDFALEGEGENGTCSQESASVVIAMDGDLYKFCGNTLPPPMSSSKNIVIVLYNSESGHGTGFRMQYTDTYLKSTDSAQPDVPVFTESGIDVNTPKSESTLLVPASSQSFATEGDQVSATTLNISASATDQSGIDFRFLGEEDITDRPDHRKRDFSKSGLERINVSASQPLEPETVAVTTTPQADLETGVMATTELGPTINDPSSITLPGNKNQPKVTGMGGTDSGLVESTLLVPAASSEESGISSTPNISALVTDQSGIDFRFLGEDDFTDRPDDVKRNLTKPARERINVPVSQPREPETVAVTTTPQADLETGVMTTTELGLTINYPSSITLPGYTNQPKVTDMGSTSSGLVDIFATQITTYVCISVAVILCIILITLTVVCAYKRRRRHISKSIDMGRTERSYWQNYKSWARDYTGGPESTAAQAGTVCEVDEEGEEAEDMLKQERLV